MINNPCSKEQIDDCLVMGGSWWEMTQFSFWLFNLLLYQAATKKQNRTKKKKNT